MREEEAVTPTESREVRVDRSLCMGSAQCCWYAPGTFDQDDNTIAVVIDQHGDPDEAIRTAIESCPTKAISIVDVSTGEKAAE